MPVFFRFSGYIIFFWTNENDKPIHFHIAKGKPSASSTKVWILSNDSFLLANNNSRIPTKILHRIFALMQDDLNNYKQKWLNIHGKIKYYK